MPFNALGSTKEDDVHAASAWILAEAEMIDRS
jgi:hypothetical protein